VSGSVPPGARPPAGTTSDLRIRVLSAAVLLLVAVFATWAGGLVFAVLAAVAGALILREWTAMSGPFPSRIADKAAMAFVFLSILSSRDQPLVSVAALVVVAVGVGLFSAVERRMTWLAAGILYGGLPGVAAVALRGPAPAGADSLGLVAIGFVFCVVWATDTFAYFAGRRLGGPKLAPRFSPKKTWSGAIGGLAAAVLAGVVVGRWVPGASAPALAIVAAGVSVLSQAGDIAESAMKRHFGVKDSGTLIPGHGGIMDRVDGLVVALVAAAALGLARTGGSDAAAGLLLW
jgi:phosphatidate cytidylyltransferase